MPLDDKAIAALQQGTFEIHSLDLRVERPAVEGAVLRGVGRIHQRGRQLWVTAYFSGQRSLPGPPETPAGQIIPEEEYCSLTALDEIGRRWWCERFLPKLTWLGELDSLVLDCELRFLRGIDQLPRLAPKASFQGWLFRPLRLPANCVTETRTERGRYRRHSRTRDAAQFAAAGFDFLVHSTDDQVSLSAVREAGALPAHIGDRILEALEFVTAELLAWDASVDSDGREVQTYIRGGPWNAGRPRISGPVFGGAIDSADNTWRLFDHYLRYVLQDQANYKHRLSAEWGLVLQASVGTLQTEATISTAVVESLCRFLTPAERSKTAGAGDREREVREHAPTILDAIKRVSVPQRLLDRIAGFLGSIRTRKPTDLLYELANSGELDPALLDAYERLRHASAHGDREGQGEAVGLMLDCDRVATLLHQLSFFAIGYHGPYMDYSEPGWRRATYPPATGAASPQSLDQEPGPAEAADGRP